MTTTALLLLRVSCYPLTKTQTRGTPSLIEKPHANEPLLKFEKHEEQHETKGAPY